MNTDEALQIIDSICAQVNLTREGHVKVQEAIAVIKSAISVPADQG